jgi:hypothetical protein
MSETEKQDMQKASFAKRFITPVAIVLLTMIATSIVYLHLAWRMPHGTLRDIVTFLSAAILFVSIGCGAVVIYPMAYFRGASLAGRAIACLVTPVVWNLKEMLRVSEFFTTGEALYYGLNTAFLLSVFSTLGLMGICEMICRWRLGARSGERVKVLSLGPVACIVAGIVALYVFLLWGLGVHFFYIYIQGYRALFT